MLEEGDATKCCSRGNRDPHSLSLPPRSPRARCHCPLPTVGKEREETPLRTPLVPKAPQPRKKNPQSFLFFWTNHGKQKMGRGQRDPMPCSSSSHLQHLPPAEPHPPRLCGHGDGGDASRVPLCLRALNPQKSHRGRGDIGRLSVPDERLRGAARLALVPLATDAIGKALHKHLFRARLVLPAAIETPV